MGLRVGTIALATGIAAITTIVQNAFDLNRLNVGFMGKLWSIQGEIAIGYTHPYTGLNIWDGIPPAT